MEIAQDAILDILVKLQAGAPISPDEIDRALHALEHYQHVRRAADTAFRALAKDNTYAPGPNTAWTVLGEALNKVHSDD